MVPLDLILVDFQNLVFWELVFVMPDTRVQTPEVRHSPFTLQRKALYFGDPFLIVGHCTQVGSRGRLCLCLSYLSQCISFIFCCGGAVNIVLRSFAGENYSLYSCKFVLCGRR